MRGWDALRPVSLQTRRRASKTAFPRRAWERGRGRAATRTTLPGSFPAPSAKPQAASPASPLAQDLIQHVAALVVNGQPAVSRRGLLAEVCQCICKDSVVLTHRWKGLVATLGQGLDMTRH